MYNLFELELRMKLRVIYIIVALIVFYAQGYSQTAVHQNNFKTQQGFTENKGQIIDLNYQSNPSVLYLFNSKGLNIQLKQTGFSYDVYTVERLEKKNDLLKKDKYSKFKEDNDSINWHFQRVDVSFLNANPNTTIVSKGKSADYLNYYTIPGNEEGITEVHHYSEVIYYNLYPNIDLQFVVENGATKYNFILHKGANIADIKLQFNGQDALSLKENYISIITKQGEVKETIPKSYYSDSKQGVDIHFRQLNENTFGFVGEYDNEKSIIIDPSPVRVWSTYFGGGAEDVAYDIAVDSLGNSFLCGYTRSTTNIASYGHQNSLVGNEDAFLAKYNDSGSLKWATYYGGSNSSYEWDRAHSNATDASGNIYIAGYTNSKNNIGYKGFRNTIKVVGKHDAFLAKFNTNGIRVWATYYGGDDDDWGYAVCTDSKENVYLGGYTASNNEIAFNGHKSTYTGNQDVFLVKFDSSGNRLWGTYYGGGQAERLFGATTDGNDNIIVGGFTSSNSGIFSGGVQNSLSGPSDCFIVKFDSSGGLKWGTYYGGTGAEVINDITADNDSNIYATGWSSGAGLSGLYSFNSIGSGIIISQTIAFVLKLNDVGGVEMAGYMGGNSSLTTQEGSSITVDKEGDIYFGGLGRRYDMNANVLLKDDAFIAKLMKPSQHRPRYITDFVKWYGDSDFDYGYGVSTFENTLYLAGGTYSAKNISKGNVHQTSLGGTMDAFLMKFEKADILISNVPKGPFCYNDTFSISYKYTGSEPLGNDNEFSVYTYDSIGLGKTKVASLKTTDTEGTILITIKDKNISGMSFRVLASEPYVISDFSDTFTINDYPSIYFDIAQYYNGDTAQCLKGNGFGFSFTPKYDTAGITYNMWFFGDGDSSSALAPVKTYTNEGEYDITRVRYGVKFGCTATYKQKVYVWPTPISSFTLNKVDACVDDTLEFNATSTSSGENLFYEWRLGWQSWSSSYEVVYTKDYKRRYGLEDAFNTRLITKNSYGCSDTAHQYTTINKYPNANFVFDSINPCLNGNKVWLKNLSNIFTNRNSVLTFSWEFEDGDTSSIKSLFKTFNTLGDKKVKLITTNNGVCSDSISKTITIHPNPVADFTINNDTQCLRENEFKFTNTSTFSNGGIGSLNSEWKLWVFAPSFLTNTTYVLPLTGNQTAKLTVRSAIGCSDSTEKNITVNPSPSTTISGPSTAFGKREEAYTTSLATGSSYMWDVSGGEVISGQNTNEVKIKWDENAGSVGQVYLIETNSFGCVGEPAIKIVNLEPSGVTKANNDKEILVYPNPASGRLNISISNYAEAYSVTLFNNLGQQVYASDNIKGNAFLNLTNLSKGIYIIKIEGENFVKSSKISLQ